MPALVDISGQTFDRLTAIERDGTNAHGYALWRCICSCGAEKRVSGRDLRGKKVRSCGCIVVELLQSRSTHKHCCGGSPTPTYSAWSGLKTRTLNSSDPAYADYGGRGIGVCDRWRTSFENFLEDMGERPEGMSIDRVDVNGDYEPNNCRWADATIQARNQRVRFRLDQLLAVARPADRPAVERAFRRAEERKRLA